MLPSQAFPTRAFANARVVCPEGVGTCGADRRGDRGAGLVHVAVALTGLLAFSALTIDLGVVWVARGQVQNAVDAAAHAGIVSIAYVSPTDTDMAASAAQAMAQQHSVWGETIPPAAVTTTVGECPAGSPALSGDCVNVAVERPMPVFFSRLFGAGASVVRASASAKVMLGNASPCLAPIAIPDRWIEAGGTWSYASHFQRYLPGSPGVLLPNPDSYVAPGPGSSGSGHTVAEMSGTQIVIDRGHIDAPEVLGDNYYSLDLPRVGGEDLSLDDRYVDNMTACTGQAVSIGDTVFTMGAHQILTQQAVNQLYAADPGARWDGTKVVGSLFGISPRIILMALYDPDQFSQVPTPVPEEYRAPMVVRNIVGFFIAEPMDSASITGVVMPVPGQFNQSVPAITQDAAFMRSVALVR